MNSNTSATLPNPASGHSTMAVIEVSSVTCTIRLGVTRSMRDAAMALPNTPQAP
ncbi:hypothetical protein D3C72_2074310 [compost metagenome]